MSEKLHLINLFSTFGPGGMELASLALAQRLGQSGIRSTFVILKGDTGGVPIPNGIDFFFNEARQCTGPHLLRFGKLLKWLGGDIIHARNWGAWPDGTVGSILSGRKTKLVFSFHGWCNTGKLPARRIATMKTLSSITDRIFTVSQTSRDIFASQTHINPEKISVIPNGVDTDKFNPHKEKPSANPRFVIGSAGSLKPIKNHAQLILACGNLVRDGVDIELRIAGQGHLESILRQLADQCGLNGRFKLMGQVSNMSEFYNSLDCFALPSLSEAHPNALLEAMACQLPCIASDTGGISEILEGGNCGIIVKKPLADNLSAVILKVIKEPDRMTEKAQNARLQVCKKFTTQKMADAYEKLYRSMF